MPRRKPWLVPLELLNLAQAAATVKRTPDTLRQAILRGSLKGQKIGRDWYVELSELRRYMEQAARRFERMEEQ